MIGTLNPLPWTIFHNFMRSYNVSSFFLSPNISQPNVTYRREAKGGHDECPPSDQEFFLGLHGCALQVCLLSPPSVLNSWLRAWARTQYVYKVSILIFLLEYEVQTTAYCND
jgi:hypothetical protein